MALRKTRGEIFVLSVNSSGTISHLFISLQLDTANLREPRTIVNASLDMLVTDSTLAGHRVYRVSNDSSGGLALISRY